jgi:drug/metabolite transporter (DMT)-like permease
LIATKKNYWELHFVVFLFGFTAILGKLVSIPAVEMVFYRTLIAAIGMFAVVLVTRTSFNINSNDRLKVLLTGAIVAIHWITFFASGRISNPSTSLVGFATCSFWAALIEPIAKRKKIHAVEVGLGIVVLIGLALIFSFDFNYAFGLFLGISSGLTAALFSVINSKLATRINAYTITFYEMMGACITIALFFPIYQFYLTDDKQLHLTPALMDWLYISIMAIACSVYAYSVMINLSKKFSVFFLNLALNLEPVYGILIALLVFGHEEVMSWNFYVGTLIILGAVVFYPYLRERWEKRELRIKNFEF